MTTSQRAALIDMLHAILNCSCAPADIKARAHILRLGLGSIFG